jgi:PBS lyase HEAT-like repeat
VNRDQALAAAQSTRVSDRMEAASALAEMADAEVEPVLVKLLDDENLAVIGSVADALLQRAEPVGIRLFCIGFERANDQVGDHLTDSLRAVERNPRVVAVLKEAAREGQAGAVEALNWLRVRF